MTQSPLWSSDRSSGWAAGRPALRRAGRALAVAPFVASTLTGCYRYARVDGAAPPVGAQVAAEINDQGRVALADSLGRSPGTVEGRLLSADDSSFTLSVSGVRSLRGDERTPWAGERVTLRRTSVGELRQRRLATGATALAGAAVLGAVVALAVSLGITGDSDGEPGERKPGTPPGEQ